MVIYFAKDILVIFGLYVFLPWRSPIQTKKSGPSAVPGAALIFVWFAGAQVFNPGSPAFFYGFSPEALLYHPLMYLGYALMDSEQDLRRFFMFNAF